MTAKVFCLFVAWMPGFRAPNRLRDAGCCGGIRKEFAGLCQVLVTGRHESDAAFAPVQ